MLTLRELEGKKFNLHTHTTRCNHAKGTDREYVEAAIKAGYEILGFSDHSPYYFDPDYDVHEKMRMEELPGYVDSVLSLKEEYKDDITIYLGLEMEYYKKHFKDTLAEIKKYPMDYLILGQHGYSGEKGDDYTGHPTDSEEKLKLYVDLIKEAFDTGEFLYVAHPDLIHYTGPIEIYYKRMKDLALYLKSKNLPTEININGIKVGAHYTSDCFADIVKEVGLDYIIGVDAHSPQALLDEAPYRTGLMFALNRDGHIINKPIEF